MLYDHLTRRPARLGATIDWSRITGILRDAASAIGDSPERADRLVQLWQSCPECVSNVLTDPTQNAAVVAGFAQATLKGLDAKTDIACMCKGAAGYTVTQTLATNAKATFDKLSIADQQKIPFGWGWILYDDKGQPVYYVPKCASGEAWNDSTKSCTAVVTTPSSGASGSGVGLILLGVLAVGIVAFVAGAGGKKEAAERAKKIGAAGYAKSKELAVRGYEAAKPVAERAGRAAYAKGQELAERGYSAARHGARKVAASTRATAESAWRSGREKASELASRARARVGFAQNPRGGLARQAGMKLSDFDQEQLRRGMNVEFEHTSDPRLARRIASDHLTEDRDYYRKLAACVER